MLHLSKTQCEASRAALPSYWIPNLQNLGESWSQELYSLCCNLYWYRFRVIRNALMTLLYDTLVFLETSRALCSWCVKTADMDYTVCSIVVATAEAAEWNPLRDVTPKNVWIQISLSFCSMQKSLLVHCHLAYPSWSDMLPMPQWHFPNYYNTF